MSTALNFNTKNIGMTDKLIKDGFLASGSFDKRYWGLTRLLIVSGEQTQLMDCVHSRKRVRECE